MKVFGCGLSAAVPAFRLHIFGCLQGVTAAIAEAETAWLPAGALVVASLLCQPEQNLPAAVETLAPASR